MATVSRADELEAQAADAEKRGDVRGAAMLLFHCAGVLDAVLREADVPSAPPPEDLSALRQRALACRAQAEALQTKAAKQAEAAEKQRAEQRKKDRPSPVAAVAAVGAVAAFTAVGPVTALAAAATCALASTRSDSVGQLVRGTGELAADVVAATRTFDREHDLSNRAAKVATQAEQRFLQLEDDLKGKAPNAAAMLGTAYRGFKVAAGSTRLAMAASVLKAPDAGKK
jgi:hypothetical protein